MKLDIIIINLNLGTIALFGDNTEAFFSEEQNNQSIEMLNYITNKANDSYSNTFCLG